MRSTGPLIAGLTTFAVFLAMAGEAVLSRVNEAALRRLGAIEPPDDVYRTMRWAYPASFVALAIEGAWSGPAPPMGLVAGLAVFGLAKALKLWAIAALGPRWSFRILVLPAHALVTRGPYRWMHHPNYLAVLGELAGVALIVRAPLAGALTLAGFGALMWRRIRIEDRALGRQ
jgi:methyltransferase